MTEHAIAAELHVRPRGRRAAARPNPALANAMASLAGAGLGLTLLLTISTERLSSLGNRGELVVFLGRLAGMAGAYAMIVLVLLVARLPVIERVAGQDRLVAWHRRLGPWPLYLVAAHGVLITLGYAAQARTGAAAELWTLLTTYPGVLAGTAAFGLLIGAGVSSYRRIRRRLAYETWWAVHLYTYLALFLAFSHQVANGQPFVGHPVARAIWTAMWVGAAAAILAYRVGVPLVRTLVHRPVVESVQCDGPDVVSIIVRGRALDRLPVSGGQFLQWRVLRRALWWHAHPYSLSSLPRNGRLRLTVKAVGDHSRALARVAPGTRLAIEGPYGAFTRDALRGDRVLLVGAGVGITPVRALLEDLPAGVDADVIVRASSDRELVLRDEIRAWSQRRGARLHELVGPRAQVPLHRDALLALVPDVAVGDVYVCGPDGFMTRIAHSAVSAGADPARVHFERFEF
ncbi:MAG: ferredoxin reductase family protein [Actinobacteria bacterium]|nr:ferredoxin reductase family protein [Actinomycetota bacterium]